MDSKKYAFLVEQRKFIIGCYVMLRLNFLLSAGTAANVWLAIYHCTNGSRSSVCIYGSV
jgi:hypothetical protein